MHTERRGRGKTIVSLVFLLIMVAKHSEQPPEEGGLAGFVSVLKVIPEVAGELARELSALLNSGSQ